MINNRGLSEVVAHNRRRCEMPGCTCLRFARTRFTTRWGGGEEKETLREVPGLDCAAAVPRGGVVRNQGVGYHTAHTHTRPTTELSTDV